MSVQLNPHVVFYHIEKCAGTSLEEMFYDYFKHIYLENEIYVPRKNDFRHYDFSEKTFFEENDFKVILGHISVNESTSDFTDHIKITCIRNPIDRMISHYYYFDYDKYNMPLHCLTNEQLNEYVTNKKAILMRLSGYTFHLETALQNLRNINVILIFEKLEEDVAKLNQVFNEHFKVDVDLKMKKLNAREQTENDTNKDKDKECLFNSGLLYDELTIYNYIWDMNEDCRFMVQNKTN